MSRARSAPQTIAADSGRGLPRWVRWGLVGAAAGAVTFPLVNGVSPNPERSAGRAAAERAVVGFVLIGGSVALWDALCRGDTRSRWAGLC